MSLNFQLATAAVTTADVAIFTNVTNQVTKVTAITLSQPSTAVLKIVSIGIGTTATAANIKYTISFAAGQQSTVIYPGWVLTSTQTLNVVASAGTTEAVITVSGVKDLVA